MNNVIPLRPRVTKNVQYYPPSSSKGEALAFQVVRLCLTSKWSDKAKAKAKITGDKMRAELAKIIFQLQGLKRAANAGDTAASLELISFSLTLIEFEDGLLNNEILGLDNS